MPAQRWAGFRSVLCPVDFSEQARLALRCAEAIARRGKGTLTVAYANDPLLVTAAAVALHDRNIAKRSAGELRHFVDATLTADATKDRMAKLVVSVGSAATEIMKAAVRNHCDLIVMGTQGLTGSKRLLMGSTTLSILQRTAIPVLAVPPRIISDDPVPLTWPRRRIMAAIELDRAAHRDVDVAVELASWWGASLLLVHAVSTIDAPDWVSGNLQAHERRAVSRAQRQLNSLATAVRRRVRTDARVVCGRPGDEIAALAASEGIDLVITALRDRRGWFGSRRGAVSYHVLSHAVTPVLAHPQQWRPR